MQSHIREVQAFARNKMSYPYNFMRDFEQDSETSFYVHETGRGILRQVSTMADLEERYSLGPDIQPLALTREEKIDMVLKLNPKLQWAVPSNLVP